MMICIMPMADGQTIHPEVLLSIGSQTTPVHLMPLTRPKDLYESPDHHRPDYKGTTTVRNELIKLGTKKSYKYILHLDSDVVLKNNHDVEDMINFLDTNPDIHAVVLNTKDGVNTDMCNNNKIHFCMACVMFRKEVLENYTFHNGDNTELCNCKGMTDDFNKFGYNIRYLDDRQLREIPKQA